MLYPVLPTATPSPGFSTRSNINQLPPEILEPIAQEIFLGLPTKTQQQLDRTLAALQDLSSLNTRWKQAFEPTTLAAEIALATHRLPTGKRLANALRRLAPLGLPLQEPSWKALDVRFDRTARPSVRNTGLKFIENWPQQAPAGMRQSVWDERRDRHLARFTAVALRQSCELMAPLMQVVIESAVPMPLLVDALLGASACTLDNPDVAQALDQHADRMPRWCRSSFQAAMACQRRAASHLPNFSHMLDLLSQIPPRPRSLFLGSMDDRMPFNSPAKQEMQAAIAELPVSHRRTALEKTEAVGWEAARVNMYLASLPADPALAASHLERFLDTFRREKRFCSQAELRALIPVWDLIARRLQGHGTACLMKLLGVFSRNESPTQWHEAMLAKAVAYSQRLPPAQASMVRLAANAVLARHGETRVEEFQLELDGLLRLPPAEIPKVIEALCDPGLRLPSYIFMSSLDHLNGVFNRIPVTMRREAKAPFSRMLDNFTHEERNLIVQQLSIPASYQYAI
ncbi:hypothetical protein [Xylophilus sp. GOD-11R]|uniref:hypothetical protein n=1 Tax=Xylophilus sp. GOD-11R TaxID=3089814 RepID=UPI00298C27F8|nr:hypothetical protein [Xylophilus sp. GOD-11R]WPB58124.1 hypothetical protein R9X41_05655 [Xylophilus sp. GOD-11R]